MTQQADLEIVIRELDAHISDAGWDQPVQLFAILSESPELAMDSEYLKNASQEQLFFEPQGIDFSDNSVIDVLRTLGWNEAVIGLAIAAERIISVEDKDASDYETQSYSATQEIRVMSIAMRDGRTLNAIRYRSHDNPEDLLTGAELVPELNQALIGSMTID